MKILIAVDLGEMPRGSNPVMVDRYNKITEKREEITLENMINLKPGDIISFDESYLEHDRDDDNFFEAEFHGILEEK